jgi:poly [ADP-ribose] polymerase
MFGKGVYFADMCSKSANYCCTSRDSPTGILLLCEVALGNMNEKLHADYYAANLPADKHSTKGLGRVAPEAKNEIKTKDGVVIPMGPGEPTGIMGTHLQYN